MNVQALTQLVAQGENEILEFKSTTGQRKEGVKTACGMLNGLGGYVLFGVTDHGGIVGQSITTHTAEEIVNELRRIEPSPPHSIECVELDNGKSVLIISLPKADGGPYTYDGRPYMRRGPTTSVMPQTAYEQLMLERMESSHRWENRPAQGITIEDLDGAEIVLTVEEAIRRHRLDDPITRNVSELLIGLGLIQKDQILSAAVVLFGKSERLLPNYSQCLLRMARFRGSDKTEFLDNRQEIGNAFDLLRRAQRFLRDHLPVAGRIIPGVYERVDDPLYPPVALREAVANALCHRNYGVPGGAVNIAIFDDRLEISSTGDLPSGITLEALTRPHNSQPRNPLIAQSLFRSGVIESWGRGTIKMIELAAQAGLPPPEFEAGTGEVLVRFRVPRETHLTRYLTTTEVEAARSSTSIPDVLRVEFVPRKDREGNDLAERLKQELSPAENRIVALWGAGGVGKTALAAQVARSLSSAYAQHVVWVSADGREDFSPSTFLDEIATQLGRPDLRQHALDLKKEHVRDLIMKAPTLIVLDNFETIRPEEGALCINWLGQVGFGSALITTRQNVENVRNIPVESMSTEEAHDFLRRLTAQVHDPGVFKELDYDRVIHTAEGNPLVLQWIIGQIDLAQDPEEVLEDLAHGEGAAAQRVFDRSYNLPQLTTGGRAVLLALSMFVPSATRPALAEVAGMGKEKDRKRFKEAVKALSALWLIRAIDRGQRLSVEGVTRELAKARISSDPRAGVFRQRFIARFLRYAEAHKDPTPGDLNALELEKGNLLNAIDIALELNDWPTVTRVSGYLNDFLDLRGYWNEAIRYGEQAASAAREMKDELRAAQFEERAAVIRMRQGEYSNARQTFERVLPIYRQLESAVNVSNTLHNLARLAQEAGDILEARSLYSESLEISKALNNKTGIADSLQQLGRIAQISGETNEAKSLYLDSLELNRRLGDKQGIASSLHNLGNLAYDQHAFEEARQLYEESLGLSRRLGDQESIARTLHKIGMIKGEEGDKTEAIRMLGESINILEKLGSPYAEITRRDLEVLANN
jgi:ATP-dependent DNA helicase RecG